MHLFYGVCATGGFFYPYNTAIIKGGTFYGPWNNSANVCARSDFGSAGTLDGKVRNLYATAGLAGQYQIGS